MPQHFAEGADDLLMRSLITKYALEGNTDDKPNGHFYVTKSAAAEACDEVVDTHFGYKGQKKQ